MIWLLKDFDLLSVLLRAAMFAAEAFALGGLIFLLAVAKPCGADAFQLRRTREIARIAAVALLLFQSTIITLSIATLMGDAGFPLASMLSAPFVKAGAAGMAGSLLLFLGFSSAGRWAHGVATAGGCVVLGSAVAQSHAASRLNHRLLLEVSTALHHLGMAGWVGAMIFLLLALRQSADLPSARRLARGYSTLALVSVPTLVISGVVMGWYFIGSWDGLIGTTYGILVMAKTYLLLVMVLLGASNYRLLRMPSTALAAEPAAAGTGLLRGLRRLSEVEIAFGLTAMLAAASLTSQPAAVDLPQDQLSWHQIEARLRWETPRLTSPPFSKLTPPTSIRTAVQVAEYSAGSVSDANDRAWSEYNHHWAGLVVLACGLLALSERLLPPGRLRRLAANWPLLFIGLAVFILLRADPENWPLGPRPFWASFSAPDALEHRLFAVLITCFAAFEWAVATGRLRTSRAAYVFPLLCAAGGAALLTHTAGQASVQQETLIEISHTGIAILGATAGCARWLQLRLRDSRVAYYAGLVWPFCFMLIGALLLDYRES